MSIHNRSAADLDFWGSLVTYCILFKRNIFRWAEEQRKTCRVFQQRGRCFSLFRSIPKTIHEVPQATNGENKNSYNLTFKVKSLSHDATVLLHELFDT